MNNQNPASMLGDLPGSNSTTCKVKIHPFVTPTPDVPDKNWRDIVYERMIEDKTEELAKPIVEITTEEAGLHTLQTKIDHWKQVVGLSDWTIVGEFLGSEEFEDHHHANVEFDPFHFQATIFIDNSHPENQWDWSIVHELLHIVMEPLQTYYEGVLVQVDNTLVRAVLDSNMLRIMEPTINKLSRAIVGKPRPMLER